MEATRKFAFVGVRSCDIHAISVQDKVFMNGQYIDQHYKSQRNDTFIVAVNCGKAGGTCFCVSMNTGPRASFGFDLAMTEIIEGKNHYFLVETGTELGAEILREIPHKEASEKEKTAADDIVKKQQSKWVEAWTPLILKTYFTETMNILVGTMWQSVV